MGPKGGVMMQKDLSEWIRPEHVRLDSKTIRTLKELETKIVSQSA